MADPASFPASFVCLAARYPASECQHQPELEYANEGAMPGRKVAPISLEVAGGGNKRSVSFMLDVWRFM